MYSRIRYVHWQGAIALHFGLTESFYVIETYITIVLAIYETYTDRVGIGGDGCEYQFSSALRLNTLPLSRCKSSSTDTLHTLPLS